MELFSDFMGMTGGGQALGRYAHYLAGITWIGLLYFFNFIQGSAFAEMSDGARGEALRKITWRALWWFRWAALGTWVTGIWILIAQEVRGDYFRSAAGMGISFGFLLGTTMAANVWMVIWPAQQIAIGSSVKVSEGGEADPAAPAAAKRAARASRVNTLFSFPLIFFMMFPSHFSANFGSPTLDSGARITIWIAMELAALGKLGGYDGFLAKKVMDKHTHTIGYGLGITLVLYLLFEILG